LDFEFWFAVASSEAKNCALQCSSNTAEYEAHLTSLTIMHVINTMHLKIKDDMKTVMQEDLQPWVLKSSINQIDAPITDLLRKEFERFSSNHED
jgi:ribonuclease HI